MSSMERLAVVLTVIKVPASPVPRAVPSSADWWARPCAPMGVVMMGMDSCWPSKVVRRSGAGLPTKYCGLRARRSKPARFSRKVHCASDPEAINANAPGSMTFWASASRSFRSAIRSGRTSAEAANALPDGPRSAPSTFSGATAGAAAWACMLIADEAAAAPRAAVFMN